jgi:hypothetical protein
MNQLRWLSSNQHLNCEEEEKSLRARVMSLLNLVQTTCFFTLLLETRKYKRGKRGDRMPAAGHAHA